MASRPWDKYPLWKKILLAPLIPFYGVAPKKITIYGILISMIGSGLWGAVFVLEPIAVCLSEENGLDKSNEETALEVEESKNITAFESERQRCLGIQKCLGEADSTLGDMMFKESLEACEPYLTNSTDPHGAGIK